MIIHVVLLTWKDGVTKSQIDALDRALEGLSELPEVKKLVHGSDVKFRPGNADFGVVAHFADETGWRAYQSHPAHKAVVAEYITPMAATRTAIQMSEPETLG